MTSPPQWLSREERAAWLALSGLFTKLPGALDAQLQRDSDLSYFEYMVLALLSEQECRTAKMSRIAELTNGSMSRLSHVASRLEKRGYLTRRPSPDDRRITLATLTEDGMAKVESAAPGHVRRVRELIFDTLRPGQPEQLREIGERIMARVDPSWEVPEAD